MERRGARPHQVERRVALAARAARPAGAGRRMLRRQGKWYPGESLPRWALDVVGLRDGTRLWSGRRRAPARPARPPPRCSSGPSPRASGWPTRPPMAALEDPWHSRPRRGRPSTGVNPLEANLADGEERRRLARVLDRGLADAGGLRAAAGPRRGSLAHRPLGVPARGTSSSSRATRPPGCGCRSSRWAGRCPRRPRPSRLRRRPAHRGGRRWPAAARSDARQGGGRQPARGRGPQAAGQAAGGPHRALRRAARRRAVRLPAAAPVGRPTSSSWSGPSTPRRRETGLEVRLEGYPPPWSPEVIRFSVTPDPGVLEVNVQPTRSGRACAEQIEQVFDAALHVGLHAEKYMLDGRQEGSGGGNHITLGGPTAARRARSSSAPTCSRAWSPSCSTTRRSPTSSPGSSSGPTSQAPRVDEARHDALYELEIALARLADRTQPAPPWLGDWLLRNLLVDVTGNGHRAEISIDKLFDWRSPHGRQGLVELRAFEMPPHPRMAAAQAILARALRGRLREGALPRTGWSAGAPSCTIASCCPSGSGGTWRRSWPSSRSAGSGLPSEAYRPFVEFRCPVVGRLQAGGVSVEIRNALEPWPVLGEEPGAGGTSRFVDSSRGAGRGPRRGARDRALGRPRERAVRAPALDRNGRRARGRDPLPGLGAAVLPPAPPRHPPPAPLRPVRPLGRALGGRLRLPRLAPRGAAATTPRRSRASRRRRAAPRGSPGRGRCPGRRARGPRCRTRSIRTPSTSGGTRATTRCRSPTKRDGARVEGSPSPNAARRTRRFAPQGSRFWLGAEPTFTDRASQEAHWLWNGGGRRQGGAGGHPAPCALRAPGQERQAPPDGGAPLPRRGAPPLLPGCALSPAGRRRAVCARCPGARPARPVRAPRRPKGSDGSPWSPTRPWSR